MWPCRTSCVSRFRDDFPSFHNIPKSSIGLGQMTVADGVVRRPDCHVFPGTAVLPYSHHLTREHGIYLFIMCFQVYAIMHTILLGDRMLTHSILGVHLYFVERIRDAEVSVV